MSIVKCMSWCSLRVLVAVLKRTLAVKKHWIIRGSLDNVVFLYMEFMVMVSYIHVVIGCVPYTLFFIWIRCASSSSPRSSQFLNAIPTLFSTAKLVVSFWTANVQSMIYFILVAASLFPFLPFEADKAVIRFDRW